jgi:hypothetical protein
MGFIAEIWKKANRVESAIAPTFNRQPRWAALQIKLI